jgi:hypothetical protein
MLKWDGVYPIDQQQNEAAARAAEAANDADSEELPDDHEEQVHTELGI